MSAESVAQYLAEELPAWARRRKIARQDGDGKSIDGIALSDEWKYQVKLYREKHIPKRKEVQNVKRQGSGLEWRIRFPISYEAEKRSRYYQAAYDKHFSTPQEPVIVLEMKCRRE